MAYITSLLRRNKKPKRRRTLPMMSTPQKCPPHFLLRLALLMRAQNFCLFKYHLNLPGPRAAVHPLIRQPEAPHGANVLPMLNPISSLQRRNQCGVPLDRHLGRSRILLSEVSHRMPPPIPTWNQISTSL